MIHALLKADSEEDRWHELAKEELKKILLRIEKYPAPYPASKIKPFIRKAKNK